jgi:hypothetical protein
MKEFKYKYLILALIMMCFNSIGHSQVVENKSQTTVKTQTRPKSVNDVKTLNKVLEHKQIFDDRVVVTKYSNDPVKEPEVTVIWKNK